MAENPEVLLGDCRAILPTLEAESVQTCITSPPYWGLRDYGTAQWEGGDVGCEHRQRMNHDHVGNIGSRNIDGNAFRNSSRYVDQGDAASNICKCGARRIDSQLGLEATPEEYITKMVAVFREAWRVLRDDGTLWLNLGDSYAGKLGERGNVNGTSPGRAHVWDKVERPTAKQIGLKPKDMCGIPWHLAFALQADGWYLRSDIIWAKPNPMPESVTDRPTKAHEYIFLLSKAKRYFYDAEAIREKSGEFRGRTNPKQNGSGDRNVKPGFSPDYVEFRNKRSVWTIPTQPYAEAHFATFPEEIPKVCVLAGSRVGDTVLDPFAGSGTVGKVALELGRRAILIELNPAYLELARDRTYVTPGFF